MICSAWCGEGGRRPAPPEHVPWTGRSDRVRDRQMAALFLQAATLTDDAAARERLRRRAARLIRRPVDAGPA